MDEREFRSQPKPPQWIGLFCDGLAVVGSLFAVSLILHDANEVPSFLVLAAILLGALPGIGLKHIFNELMGSSEPRNDMPKWMGDAAGRRRRLIGILIVLSWGGGIVAVFVFWR